MRGLILFLTACILAAWAPFLPMRTDDGVAMPFPGWPRHFEGRVLQKAELSEREKYFNSGFPGRIAKFTAGGKVLVIRWVTRKTRKLHPAMDCFKGVGYRVRALPLRTDRENRRWGHFEAVKNTEKALVYERIFDKRGNSWSDVSAWHWAALSGNSTGPWWAVTVVEF
ncbi:MAG: hypothetical protein GY862_35480 [Gammaproteobacteria bacterium]|nr:hypothetical protein [Gammaproteobacteria bacterium]